MLIIDRQTYFRAGMCQALSGQDDLELSDCDPTNNTIGLIETTSPDVVLLDIDPPSFSGFDLGRKITRHCPNTRLIMLTTSPNDEELFEVIKTGAVAYLDKNVTTEELVEAIRQAHIVRYPINDSLTARPRVAEHVLRQFQTIVSMGKALETVTAPLTSRETQILGYIAEGNSNKQIARILQISEQTVKNHVSAILRKVNANDRAHAVVLAIRHGWISAEEKPSSSAS